MCTVSYVPLQKDQFLFASNRDEAPKRAAAEVVQTERNGKTLLFPQDTGANGSWIAISNTGQLVCILNGAFAIHQRHPPYRLSRGIMALEFFGYGDVDDFHAHFKFVGMEPFTMVIYDQEKLFDLRWDEEKVHLKELDATQAHLWASCTLYPEQWQAKRQAWFTAWQTETPSPTIESLTAFHQQGGEGDPENDLVMNRGGRVRTTSITSIVKKQAAFSLNLLQLPAGQMSEHSLFLE